MNHAESKMNPHTIEALDDATKNLNLKVPLDIVKVIAEYASQRLDWDTQRSMSGTVQPSDTTVYVAPANQKYSLAIGGHRMSKHMKYAVKLLAENFHTEPAVVHVGLLLRQKPDPMPVIERKAIDCHTLNIGPCFQDSPKRGKVFDLIINLRSSSVRIQENADNNTRYEANSEKNIETRHCANAHVYFRVTKRVQLRIVEFTET